MSQTEQQRKAPDIFQTKLLCIKHVLPVSVYEDSFFLTVQERNKNINLRIL